MRIKVKLFASARAAVGRGELEMKLPEGRTVGEAFERLKGMFPKLAGIKGMRFAVNMEYVEPDFKLRDGDELVLIPPVSGG